MSKLLENIVKSRCGGRVERCHTIPHHGSYSNAAHSWGVAMLMYYLFPEDYPRLSIYCLTHDIGEGWMGDIPAPAKWALGDAAKVIEGIENDLIEEAGCPREDSLSSADLEKLKTCDRLELYIWCHEQCDLGNTNVWDCIAALEEYFNKGNLHMDALELYEEIRKGGQGIFLADQKGIIQELIDGR